MDGVQTRDMDTTSTAKSIRVTCDCDVCKVNAERISASFPLAADVNPMMAAALKITARNANKSSKVHGLVYMAHDPSLTRRDGTRVNAQHGPWAVGA